MNLDDRLDDFFAEQRAALPLAPEGADAVRARFARRRAVRRGALASVLTLVVGAGAWQLATAGDDEPEVLATRSAEAPDGTDAGGPAPSSDDPDDPSSGQADGPRFVVATGAIGLRDVSSLAAPAAWTIGPEQGFADGDVYYAVSTAPGRRDPATLTDADFRRDTLYSFDGESWAHQRVVDRYLGDVAAHEGVLYAVSTGSPTTSDLAVGTSSDGGASWAWLPVDDGAQLPLVRTTGGPAGQLVVASRQGLPDHELAIELARGAGIAVAHQTLRGVDSVGIRYLERTADELRCLDLVSQYWMETEERFADDALLTVGDGEVQFREAVAELSRRLVAAGCDDVTVCDTISSEVWAEAEEELMLLEEGLAGEEPSAAAEQAFEEAHRRAEELRDQRFEAEAPFCRDLYATAEGDAAYATWAELGVDVPDEWRGERRVVLVTGDGVVEVGDPFGSGSVRELRTIDGRYVAVVGEDGGGAPVEWESSDGISWARTAEPRFDPFGSRASVGERSFRIRYDAGGPRDEEQELELLVDGRWEPVRLTDLAAVVPEGYQPQLLSSGAAGLVIVAGDWSRVEAGSLVLFSTDGVTWASVQTDRAVHGAVVGDTSALLFANPEPRSGPGDELRPATAYLLTP